MSRIWRCTFPRIVEVASDATVYPLMGHQKGQREIGLASPHRTQTLLSDADIVIAGADPKRKDLCFERCKKRVHAAGSHAV